MQQEKRGFFPYNYRGGCFFNVFNLAITGKILTSCMPCRRSTN